MQDNQSALNYLLAFGVYSREDGKTGSCEKNSSNSKIFLAENLNYNLPVMQKSGNGIIESIRPEVVK